MTKRTKWILGICFGLLAITGLILASTVGLRWYRINEARQGLRHEYSRIRKESVLALARLGDKESIPAIRPMLNIKEPIARRTAIYALGQLGDTESIPAIRQMLRDQDVCSAAAIALGALNDRESIPLIKILLRNRDETISAAAEQALRSLGVPESEIEQIKTEQANIRNFADIADFYRKAFPDTSFFNLRIGAGFTDGGPRDKTAYHIFIPKDIERLYLYPYSEDFLRQQSASADPLRKMIADNLLQLKRGILSTRPGATESYNNGPEIECIDYSTPYKYYLLDHPRTEGIPVLKELLADPDKKVRDQAEQALKALGVPEEELELLRTPQRPR